MINYTSYRLYVQKLDARAKLPTVAYPGQDLGYDVYALEDFGIHRGHKPVRVRTGIAANAVGNTGQSFGLIVKDRSSLASEGFLTHGGVIDSTYRGEIIILMSYTGPLKSDYLKDYHWKFKAGDKIAQLVPVPVLTGSVHETNFVVDESTRGVRGFGSSGN